MTAIRGEPGRIGLGERMSRHPLATETREQTAKCNRILRDRGREQMKSL
jgi:hypothetical protein